MTISKLGKYEIRGELGRGAMGVVYEGFDPMIHRTVAIKTIRADRLGGTESANVVARFRSEAQAAGRLSHPNIVAIYDFDIDGDTWFIAMESIKGRELKEFFDANERFAMPDIVRIMTQVLGALDYSHKQGVIHRDIKPANIFILADGTAKVADFGIARIESSTLTQVGDVLGTPAYMSPEQIMGLPVDGRSDLFSAGVLLYQFLTGERPFAGAANTTMQKVLKEEPLPPSSLNVQLPAAMDAVVRKALAKKPAERFQSAQEFIAALQAASADDPDATVRAVTPHASAPPAAVARPATSARGVAPPAIAAAKKPRTTAIAVVVGVLILAGIAGAWMLSQRAPGGAPVVAQAPTPASGAGGGTAPAPSAAPGSPGAASPAPATAAAPAAPAPAAPAPANVADPGTMVIAAVGLVDPSDPRYQRDPALLQADLRADSKSQLVAKALGLMVARESLNKNYDVLQNRLLANSGNFVGTVFQESAPHTGKDGLVSLTTQAAVNVRALQKSLNQMSREQRIELIRAGGDPKVAVRISVSDVDQPGAPPLPSPVAENLLKERIKTFGFRTWSEGDTGGTQSADFLVQGEAKIKRLSMRLEASGVVITKYALSSWTVKCIDRATGEEIYFNTTLPQGLGSWASEEQALKAIGAKIADEFSRNFFLQHIVVAGRKVSLQLAGMPDAAAEDAFGRELLGLPAVIGVQQGPPARPRVYDVQLAGAGGGGDLVLGGVLAPLNAKLGQACFGLGAVTGDQVAVTFAPECANPAVLGRLDTNPPAGLYGAPPARQKAVIKNPDTLRKLVV